MFELNGQWFVLGNRTLNNLNLSRNGIHEEGLKALMDAVLEQEASIDNAPEGMIGIFRIALQVGGHDDCTYWRVRAIDVTVPLNSGQPLRQGQPHLPTADPPTKYPQPVFRTTRNRRSC